MRIEQFYFLKQIAEHQSITTASNYCYTTPQNISKSIRSFETELGVSLFKRTRQGIILTPDGQNILSSAEIICAEIEKIQKLYSLHKPYAANIGINDFSLLTTLPLMNLSVKIMENILKLYPNIKVSLIDAEPPFINSTDEFLNFVNSKLRTHNLIFSTIDEYNFDSFVSISSRYAIYSLFKESMCLEVPKSSPWAKEKSIPIRILPHIPLISFGVSNEITPFFHGVLIRRYNLQLRPTVITNAIFESNDLKYFRENYARICTPFTWHDDGTTKLIPFKEKCFVHQAMFIPHNLEYTALIQNIILPLVKEEFPDLYQFN